MLLKFFDKHIQIGKFILGKKSNFDLEQKQIQNGF